MEPCQLDTSCVPLFLRCLPFANTLPQLLISLPFSLLKSNTLPPSVLFKMSFILKVGIFMLMWIANLHVLDFSSVNLSLLIWLTQQVEGKPLLLLFLQCPPPRPHVECELREGGLRPLPEWSQSEDWWFKASTALPPPTTSKKLFSIKGHSFWAQGSMLVKLSKPWFHRWRVCVVFTSDVVRGASDVVTKLTLTSGGRMNWKGKKWLKCSRQKWTKAGTTRMEDEKWV